MCDRVYAHEPNTQAQPYMQTTWNFILLAFTMHRNIFPLSLIQKKSFFKSLNQKHIFKSTIIRY